MANNTIKVPIYLSGAIRPEIANRPEFGYMRTPNMGNKVGPEQTWFADNGCFSLKGERDFHLDKYLSWLKGQNPSTCLGATAPDKVGDAEVTLTKSLPVLPELRRLGYKASLVAQDGLEKIAVPWDAFDVLFIGGTTEWKLGAGAVQLMLEAQARGKWVHMGRVNSFKRYLFAAFAGCDSVDGTFLAFGPTKNLPRLESWISTVKAISNQGPYNNEETLSCGTYQWLLRLRSERLANRGAE